jgi:hypothetical protein
MKYLKNKKFVLLDEEELENTFGGTKYEFYYDENNILRCRILK